MSGFFHQLVYTEACQNTDKNYVTRKNLLSLSLISHRSHGVSGEDIFFALIPVFQHGLPRLADMTDDRGMKEAEFQLVSDHSPAGDQPQAIEALIKGRIAVIGAKTLLGVTGSGKTYTDGQRHCRPKPPGSGYGAQ
ncbi:MAG: hypothetical protein R2857_14155 [Vampirovibrionales bacterium]